MNKRNTRWRLFNDSEESVVEFGERVDLPNGQSYPLIGGNPPTKDDPDGYIVICNNRVDLHQVKPSVAGLRWSEAHG